MHYTDAQCAELARKILASIATSDGIAACEALRIDTSYELAPPTDSDITLAMARAGGSKLKAAKLAGITRKGLARRLGEMRRNGTSKPASEITLEVLLKHLERGKTISELSRGTELHQAKLCQLITKLMAVVGPVNTVNTVTDDSIITGEVTNLGQTIAKWSWYRMAGLATLAISISDIGIMFNTDAIGSTTGSAQPDLGLTTASSYDMLSAKLQASCLAAIRDALPRVNRDIQFIKLETTYAGRRICGATNIAIGVASTAEFIHRMIAQVADEVERIRARDYITVLADDSNYTGSVVSIDTGGWTSFSSYPGLSRLDFPVDTCAQSL